MPKKRKPKAASDGDTPLAPITAEERRRIDKWIKSSLNDLSANQLTAGLRGGPS
jgi:hypothetical protein